MDGTVYRFSDSAARIAPMFRRKNAIRSLASMREYKMRLSVLRIAGTIWVMMLSGSCIADEVSKPATSGASEDKKHQDEEVEAIRCVVKRVDDVDTSGLYANVNLGVVQASSQPRFRIGFKNPFEVTAAIEEVATSCSCVSANYTKEPVVVGGDFEYEIIYRASTKFGQFATAIRIGFVDRKSKQIGDVKLRIHGEVRDYIQLSESGALTLNLDKSAVGDSLRELMVFNFFEHHHEPPLIVDPRREIVLRKATKLDQTTLPFGAKTGWKISLGLSKEFQKKLNDSGQFPKHRQTMLTIKQESETGKLHSRQVHAWLVFKELVRTRTRSITLIKGMETVSVDLFFLKEIAESDVQMRLSKADAAVGFTIERLNKIWWKVVLDCSDWHELINDDDILEINILDGRDRVSIPIN